MLAIEKRYASAARALQKWWKSYLRRLWWKEYFLKVKAAVQIQVYIYIRKQMNKQKTGLIRRI
jgi:hypothetical protein